MPVARDQSEIVFQSLRANPKVHMGNGRTGPFQLDKQPRPLLRGLAAGEQDADGFLGQEFLQDDLVPVPPAATLESRLDLRQHEERNPNFFASSQQIGQFGIASQEVG